MKEAITSSQNKVIKHIKSLHSKKFRDNLMEYIIEGYKLIEEALAYGNVPSVILVSSSSIETVERLNLFKRCEESGIQIHIAEDKIFQEASEMETPQGVLAVLNKKESDLQSILEKPSYQMMILDEVRDPGNVGTIIRTADACGISAVILTKGCVDLYNAKTIRSTMGSMYHIPVITDVDISLLLNTLKEHDAQILGADPHSNISCIDVPRHERTAIIIGNEANGLKDEVKRQTSLNVTIPMPGQAESLNAGVAAAILMYEFAVRK